jgi:ABC-type cobalt transport system substrate-binding protein
MLAQEGEAQAIPRPAMISPQHIIRSAIALIIMLAVLWPLITGSQEAPLPSFSPGTAAVNQLINGLPDQAQVLLAFDYEPALTGEMEPAASAVVDHLMLRGAYLSLVSTSPLGPIVAERFLSTTQAEHGYASDSQYVNLGFIPGGPAGLLAFAESPGRVLPYTLEGNPAWGRGDQPALPPLQGVTHLSDFDLVMVITDSPEAARTWVEQAQPFLEDESAQTPLVMVTSAQAEPLVRPYYQPTSGQVQGLLSGLRDGGAYGRLTGSEGLTRKYWDAFGLGLWVAAAVITVGGLVNVGLGVGRDRGWGIRDRG